MNCAREWLRREHSFAYYFLVKSPWRLSSSPRNLDSKELSSGRQTVA